MPKLLLGCAAALLVLLAVDRALLLLESRGWINYRRRGLSRGGTLYHILELHSIFDPGIRPVIEARYGEDAKGADSGAPPARDDLADDEEGPHT